MENANPKPPLQILLAGDAMLGRGVNQVIWEAGPAYPLDPIAEVTRSADLFFVNLECAITGQDRVYSGPPKAFYFRSDPHAAKTLVHAGVDLVSLANNHALDADPEGLFDTMAILNANGILHAGAGENLAAASRPVYLEEKGHRLGILAYCDHQADFMAERRKPGIRYIDLSNRAYVKFMLREVETLAREVDHVVVAFHWMPNWVHQIPRFYRSLAGWLVAAGARIVWGHSPHHFLGVEWMGNSVVVYSSGGLVDDYSLEPVFRNDRQLLFQVRLKDHSVEQVFAFPIELEFARTYPAHGKTRDWILKRFQGMCADLKSSIEEKDGWIQVRLDEEKLV